MAKSFDKIDISINTCTIQCCLGRNGLYGNWPQLTLFQNPCQIVAHFNFAKMFLDKENSFWEQVLWSDETKIDLEDLA